MDYVIAKPTQIGNKTTPSIKKIRTNTKPVTLGAKDWHGDTFTSPFTITGKTFPYDMLRSWFKQSADAHKFNNISAMEWP